MPASASEWATPYFAGEHGHATAANPSAIYYNPAAMGLGRGHRILLDNTISLRWSQYDRPAAGPDDVAPGEAPVQDQQATLEDFRGANDGRAHAFTPISIPFIGVQSDLGTKRFTLGAAYYVPYDSAIRWNGNAAFATDPRAPQAIDGVARWHAIDRRTSAHAVSLALAFSFRRIGLSLGATATALRTQMRHEIARTPGGTDNLHDANGARIEGRERLTAGGWQGSFTVGAVYDVAAKGKAWIGLAYASRPNVVGSFRMRGELVRSGATGAAAAQAVDVWQSLPDVLRLGIRVRPGSRWELRANAEWWRWSAFDHQCITDRRLDHDACAIAGDPLASPERYGLGSDLAGVHDFTPRAWRDTLTARLGVSIWFRPRFEGFVSAGYETRAAPLETLDPSLVSTAVIAPTVGFRWQATDAFAISTSWTERFGLPVSTRGRSELNRYPVPIRRPSADGVYRQFTQLLNVYAELSF